jgi:hypothetical protein
MTEEFNKWWNTDGLVEGNPYTRDTPAFWAWEGWQAAYEQTICANCAKEIHNCARCGEVNPAEIHTCTPKREPSGSWTSWDNTMCNPVADARIQTQSAWQDGYDSAKAEWQGLTDDEKLVAYSMYEYMGSIGFVQAIEARLKEKNS